MICSKCGRETGSNENICESCKMNAEYGMGDIYSQKKPMDREALEIDAALKTMPREEDLLQHDRRKKTKVIAIISVAAALVAVGVAVCLAVVLNKPKAVPKVQPKADKNVNTVGNTPENILNGGIATVQGDYIYYAQHEVDDTKTGKARIADSGIYRMKTDGSAKSYLGSAYATSVNAVGDYIYYSDALKNSFYRMRLDGGGVTTVISKAVDYATVTTDYIFYLDTEKSVLHRTNIDGSGDSEFLSPVVSYYISGKKVYYKESVDSTACGSIGIDGKNKSQLSGNYAGKLMGNKNTVYAVDNAGNIYRTNTEDGEQKLIYTAKLTSDSVCAADGYVYFGALYDKSAALSPAIQATAATTEDATEAATEATTAAEGDNSAEQALYRISENETAPQIICNQGVRLINAVGNRLFCIGTDELTFTLNTDGSNFEYLSKKVNRSSEEYLRSELAKHSGDNVLSFEYQDYNGDGVKEAFAFTGTASSSGNFNGELWYLTPDKTEKVMSSAEYSIIGMVYTFGNQKLYRLESHDSSQMTKTYLFGVNQNGYYMHPLSGCMGLTIGEDGIITAYDVQHDASATSGGSTKKPYWLYYSDNSGRFVEYGGLRLNERQLFTISGVKELLASKLPQSGRIVNAFYRNNGIINVNYTDGEWQGYISLLYKDNKLSIYEEGDGFYKAALYPSYAVYPDSGLFPDPEATTEKHEDDQKTTADSTEPTKSAKPTHEKA